ncbi:MAG: N-acetyltransferase family protein [Proteobacteria bacterium]|nr:MAG: N-acetyltransferase family protein [Pseudomonadota bacterium]
MSLPESDLIIRMATLRDAEAILSIYGPYIDKTAVSFEYTVPTLQEFQNRMQDYLAFAPWLVATKDGRVLGYAYASKYRAREAYSWAIEVSVYLAEDARGQGLGAKLYEELFTILTLCGYRQAFAVVTLPNEASVKHHARMGFEPIGVFQKVGFKFGAWHDVGWYRKELLSFEGSPSPIRPYQELQELTML